MTSKQVGEGEQAPVRCAGTRADGAPCRARVLTDEEYCFFHSPTKTAERALARQDGGRARAARVLPGTPQTRIVRSADDVVALLSDVIGHVLRGEIDPKVANSAGYLSGLLLKALQQGELEERFAALEAVIRGARPTEYAFDRDPEEILMLGGSDSLS